MNENICHFIPYHKDYHSIHTINFVLETKPQVHSAIMTEPVYKIYFICSGKGNLHMANKILSLKQGDVFFTFPAVPRRIEALEDLSYMYISFLGSRANMIMDNLKISSRNFHFGGCQEIFDFWKNGLTSNPETTDLIAESILLYSFHYLCNKIIQIGSKKDLKENIALVIKKYIDDNFPQPKLSLEVISNELSYSPKYISSVFKRSFNVGIAEYLNIIRIQNACALLQQGFTSISEVSNQCGYADSQYFSKVFKKRIGVSPKVYRKTL